MLWKNSSIISLEKNSWLLKLLETKLSDWKKNKFPIEFEHLFGLLLFWWLIFPIFTIIWEEIRERKENRSYYVEIYEDKLVEHRIHISDRGFSLKGHELVTELKFSTFYFSCPSFEESHNKIELHLELSAGGSFADFSFPRRVACRRKLIKFLSKHPRAHKVWSYYQLCEMRQADREHAETNGRTYLSI